MVSPRDPSVAIVIPAYNAAHLLPQVLDAARAAAGDGRILVVDPGSTDATAAVAERHGAEVIRLAERAGPARARNVGVAHVDEDVVLFVDSDCVPHPDVVERVREAFAADPQLVSLTGSYDDDPPEPGFFSQYMNLRHHLTHQQANREQATFWAGCGAVRREAFLAVGGFDPERYPRPQVEDIELGYRLREKGATRLDPDLQVKHLKRWTMQNVVYTDIVERGVPWTELMLEQGEVANDLNLRPAQRVAAALAPLLLCSVAWLPAALLLGLPGQALAAAALIAVGAFLQRGLVRAFARLRGVRFAAAAFLFHQIHLSYSGAVFAFCWLRHRL